MSLLSGWVLNASRDGSVLTIFAVKKMFPIFNWNFPCSSLCPLPLVLLLHLQEVSGSIFTPSHSVDEDSSRVLPKPSPLKPWTNPALSLFHRVLQLFNHLSLLLPSVQYINSGLFWGAQILDDVACSSQDYSASSWPCAAGAGASISILSKLLDQFLYI